jgi:EAL domain-containing protein (putative c-di-GMP-specific phosphodiesterase class I)
VRSDRFLIFRGVGPEEVEGLGAEREHSERLLATLRARVATAAPTSALRSIRLGSGRAWIREDPMIRAERVIQQGVADAMLGSLEAREGVEAARRDELAQMVAQGGVRTVFHPIVRLHDRSVVGYEALTRPLRSQAFESVEDLFAFAESTDLIMDFERLCRSTAIRSARQLPPGGLLFLNASARAVEDPEWAAGGVEELLRASGLRAEDVVVEITERVAIVHHDAFRLALRTFKDRGFRVAVDDMGAGYSSLQALASVEPDFLKFDVSLVRDIDRSGIKRSLLESLHTLADKIRARVIAEGVEREEERATLLSLGIELGQGFHFHREESS